jgi:hypothetical protein
MPYVSLFVRFPSQMQPWAALSAIVGSFIFFLMKKTRLPKNVKFIVALSLVLTLYITSDSVIDLDYVKKNLGLIFSISVLIFYYYYGFRYEYSKVLYISLYIYLFFALLQYVSSSLFVSLSSIFLEVTDIYIDERGAASLMPEATDFGFTLNFFILISYIFYKVGVLSLLRLKYITILCLIMIFLSKSASGVMTFILIACSIYTVSAKVKKEFVIATCLISFFLFSAMYFYFDALIEIRGFAILVDLIREPSSIMLTSFAHRFIHNVVGIIGFFDSNFLGFGAGTWSSKSVDVFELYRLDVIFDLNSYYSHAVVDSLSEAPLSNIGFMLFEYGVFGFIFCYLVFFNITKVNKEIYIPSLVLMLLTWLQSFPIAYPPFWMVVGLLAHVKCNK